MNTFNTYQEAKIANPESEIVTTQKEWKWCQSLKGKFQALDDSDDGHNLTHGAWEICNPADYCISVFEFHENGLELVAGDLYLFEGEVYVFAQYLALSTNVPSPINKERFILSAAALEQSKQEVEWKNGESCMYMNSPIIHKFIGLDVVKNNAWIKSPCGSMNMVEACKLSKPKSERELAIEQVVEVVKGNPHYTVEAIAEKLYDLGMLKLNQGGGL